MTLIMIQFTCPDHFVLFQNRLTFFPRLFKIRKKNIEKSFHIFWNNAEGRKSYEICFRKESGCFPFFDVFLFFFLENKAAINMENK